MTQPGLFSILEAELEQLPLVKINGRVAQVVGLVAESQGPDVRVGDLCRICFRDGSHGLDAEVVGFRDDRVLLMPLGDLREVGPGCDVISTNHPLEVGVGEALLGRILDGLGEPMDDRGPLAATDFYPLYAVPPHPLRRQMVERPLSVGVRVVDGMLTLGTGQRIGIFAGSGVGKSTLLGMMARYTTADVNVISLVGERGREVREFIERDLGPEGLARSVLIIATSDQPPLIRLKAALTATAVAEYFRDQGRDVLLMMDSVTRVARAQREIGLAIGEPPATRGYTPSVFEMLPRLLERAGAGERGSITGIYTVLVEGDDMNEPVADTVRGVLDRLFSLEGEKSKAVEDFCGCGCGESTASCSELWFRRQFIDSIEDRIHEGRDSLQDVRQRIAGTEARLVERHRDVRVMETYVDRLRAVDFQNRMEAEQLELDDVAMVRYSRMKKGAEA